MSQRVFNLNDTISVIVPAFNGGQDLRRCLASLVAADPGPLEILVVLDGGEDDGEALEREFAVKVLRLEEQGGPARARNAGARVAKGEVLFFVDADVVVPPDLFSGVSQVFAGDPTLAGVIGSYDDKPDVDNFIGQYRNLLHHYVHQNANTKVDIFWGACGALRAEAFRAVGGFDESYRRPSVEDIEMGYRLSQAGYKVCLQKDLQVKHLKRWTAVNMVRTDFYQRALPWTKLIHTKSGMVNNLNLNYGSRASVSLVLGQVVGIVASLLWPAVLPWIAASGLLVGVINMPLYWFFWRKRGLFFALRALPLHWFYYLYSGVAFIIGTLRHWSGVDRQVGAPTAKDLEAPE